MSEGSATPGDDFWGDADRSGAEIASSEGGHGCGLALRDQLRAGERDVAVLEETIHAVEGAGRMREMNGLHLYSRVDAREDPFEPVDLDAVFAEGA